MRFRILVAASLLLVPCVAGAANHGPPVDGTGNTAPVAIWQVATVDPPATVVTVGDDAPSFSYLGADGGWHPFTRLASGQSVLLVFGATDAELAALEQSRSAFLDLGLVPIAVIDQRVGSALAMKRRCCPSCAVICDPMCAIGELYNTLDRNGMRHAPAYFILDDAHVVRALSHGTLPSMTRLLVTSAGALGRALPAAISTIDG